MANSPSTYSDCTKNLTSNGQGPYGPLTTIFNPDGSCFYTYYSIVNAGTTTYQVPPFPIGTGSSNASIVRPECGPSNFLDLTVGNYGWFSPGVCPSGYASAFNTTWDSVATSLWFQSSSQGLCNYPLIPSETTVWCCPQGYSFQAALLTDMSICYKYTANAIVASCNSKTCTLTPDSFEIQPIQVQAYPIQVKFQPSDLPLLQSLSPSWWSQDVTTTRGINTTNNVTPGTSPTLPSLTSVSPTISSPTGVSSPPPQPGPSGISLSAKLAISITIPLVGLVCLMSVFFYFRYHKRRKTGQNDGPSEQWAKPELEATARDAKPELHELDHDQVVHELSAEARPTELIGIAI